MKKFNIQYKPGELWVKVHEYFEECEEEPTRAGLLLYLNIGDMRWRNLGKDPKFKASVEYANLKFQEMYEQRLADDKNPTGAIFALKNLGWSDKADLNVAMETDLTIEQVVRDEKLKA